MCSNKHDNPQAIERVRFFVPPSRRQIPLRITVLPPPPPVFIRLFSLLDDLTVAAHYEPSACNGDGSDGLSSITQPRAHNISECQIMSAGSTSEHLTKGSKSSCCWHVNAYDDKKPERYCTYSNPRDRRIRRIAVILGRGAELNHNLTTTTPNADTSACLLAGFYTRHARGEHSLLFITPVNSYIHNLHNTYGKS